MKFQAPNTKLQISSKCHPERSEGSRRSFVACAPQDDASRHLFGIWDPSVPRGTGLGFGIFRLERSGLTIIEVVVGLGVFTLITLAVLAFQRDFFNMNRLIGGGLNRNSEVRKVLKNFSAETRSASPSSTGSYVIESAGDNSFIFFSDIDNDGLKERLRYFLDGATLKKGTTKSSGSPLSYNPDNETLTNLVGDITGPSAVFSYYDASYDGTGSALSQPVDVSDVRMVKIILTIDPEGSKPPSPSTFTTQATLRNLRGQ